MTRVMRSVLFVAALFFVLLVGTTQAQAALVPLTAQDFPCESIPPKCPEAVGFLLQVKSLFPDEIINVAVNQRFDIDTWVCGELYVDAGGNFSVPISGLNAELFMDRDPASEYYNRVVTNMQIDNVTLGGTATLRGRDCIGFIDFDIPLGGEISWDQLYVTSRQGVWLDTATNKVVLTDDAREAAIGSLQFDFGLGGLIEGILYPFLMSWIPQLVSDTLLADNAIVFNLVESIMDQLYHTTSGCFIATAAFGNTLDAKIDVLRSFRDEYLLTNTLGKAFVTAYYEYSPPIADYIAQRPWLRAVVKTLLLPLVGFVSYLV